MAPRTKKDKEIANEALRMAATGRYYDWAAILVELQRYHGEDARLALDDAAIRRQLDESCNTGAKKKATDDQGT